MSYAEVMIFTNKFTERHTVSKEISSFSSISVTCVFLITDNQAFHLTAPYNKLEIYIST